MDAVGSWLRLLPWELKPPWGTPSARALAPSSTAASRVPRAVLSPSSLPHRAIICTRDRHGLNWVSPLVPPVPGSSPAGSWPLSRWGEGLRVVLSKAFIDTHGWPPSRGFIAWRPDPSCHNRKSMPPAHLLDRWLWPAGCAGVSVPINTPSLIKMWRLSTASLMQKLAAAQSRASAGLVCLHRQHTCPCAPPEAGSGHFLPRSWPKLLEDTAKENLPGWVGALRPCLALWGTCATWGDPISSPKRWAPGSQGTRGCPWPSPGHPGCLRSPTLPCSPQGTPTTWFLRNSGGALMSWPHT